MAIIMIPSPVMIHSLNFAVVLFGVLIFTKRFNAKRLSYA